MDSKPYNPTYGKGRDSTPHGRLFHAVFSQPPNARDLLCTILPDDLVRALDWDTLEVQPDSFLDDELHAYYADLLFTIRYQGRAAFLYLVLEHHRTSGALMPLRLMGAMTEIWLEHMGDDSDDAEVPIVIPVVIRTSARNAPETSTDIN